MQPIHRARLQIHFCVLLWGFTAIIGKLITLQALPLVWWRMLLVALTLLLMPKVWRGLRAMPARTRWAYAGIGVLVSLHWLTFYAAIKLSNASVGATCLALGPVFLAFMEPWLAKRRFDPRELFIGAAVVPGVVMVVGGVPHAMRLGLAVGVLSALFVALFGSLNKRMVEHGDPLTVTCIELGTGTLFLTLLAPLLPHTGAAFVLPSVHDALLLLVLSFGCTLLPFALALVALRHMTAFGTQMVTNLEPVYAIVLAIVLLGEQRQLDNWFYAGVTVILLAVFTHPLLGRNRRRRPAQTELLGTTESHNIVE
ncbi:MAG: DMT family transporter [Rhodanobacter sp.]|jgi:drug/metabolite transporter (DMT)-like permease|uniref:DMT family transporter n=1 Tax=Rhodanobacter glycinis TaxID=582702 RepID=A0A5B9E065_9GAMM|nr:MULTISPECIES: DMT family transporter [Rhodanobacter]EIL97138.1 integral membrane protein [Rhodanobacter sp. 115]QEE25278.1 DMT family transporter [Rhodanobacter glycinis]TAM22993.1 MAG: DMT family transporter [Rhodanobacter sp.]